MAYLSHLQESISGQVITNIGLCILSSFSHLQESISGQVGVVLPHDSIHRPPAPYVRRKVVERPIEAPERSRRRRVTPVLVCSTAHNTQHTQHTQNAQQHNSTTAQQHNSTHRVAFTAVCRTSAAATSAPTTIPAERRKKGCINLY